MSSKPEQSGGVSELELKQALTAFKKRIKVMRLDQESRLGGGRPTTSGKKSDIAGIMPPGQFRREVWEELVGAAGEAQEPGRRVLHAAVSGNIGPRGYGTSRGKDGAANALRTLATRSAALNRSPAGPSCCSRVRTWPRHAPVIA